MVVVNAQRLLAFSYALVLAAQIGGTLSMPARWRGERPSNEATACCDRYAGERETPARDDRGGCCPDCNVCFLPCCAASLSYRHDPGPQADVAATVLAPVAADLASPVLSFDLTSPLDRLVLGESSAGPPPRLAVLRC